MLNSNRHISIPKISQVHCKLINMKSLLVLLLSILSGFPANPQQLYTVKTVYHLILQKLPDDLFDLEMGTRRDIQTHLGLSPWELYVIADLTFKLTSTQCSKIDKNVLSSYEKTLMESFQKAPRSDAQHESFLPVYSGLISCLEYLFEANGWDADHLDFDSANVIAQEVVEPEASAQSEDVHSAEADWIVEPEPSTTTTEQASSSPPTPVEESESGGLGFQSIHNWFKSLFGPNHEADDSEARARAQALKDEMIQKSKEEESKRKQLIIYQKSRQNFANFFHGMSKVIRKTCPVVHRPDKAFFRKAVLDMTTWATLDKHDTISISAQYFSTTNNLLELIKECHESM